MSALEDVLLKATRIGRPDNIPNTRFSHSQAVATIARSVGLRMTDRPHRQTNCLYCIHDWLFPPSNGDPPQGITCAMLMSPGTDSRESCTQSRLPAVVQGALKKLAYLLASLVQLRFGRSDRAAKDFGDLVMLVPVHIVEDKHCFVASW